MASSEDNDKVTLRKVFMTGKVPGEKDLGDLIDAANRVREALGQGTNKKVPLKGLKVDGGILSLSLDDKTLKLQSGKVQVVPGKGLKLTDKGLAVDLGTNGGLSADDTSPVSIKTGQGVTATASGISIGLGRGLKFDGKGRLAFDVSNNLDASGDTLDLLLCRVGNKKASGLDFGKSGLKVNTVGGGDNISFNANGELILTKDALDTYSSVGKSRFSAALVTAWKDNPQLPGAFTPPPAGYDEWEPPVEALCRTAFMNAMDPKQIRKTLLSSISTFFKQLPLTTANVVPGCALLVTQGEIKTSVNGVSIKNRFTSDPAVPLSDSQYYLLPAAVAKVTDKAWGKLPDGYYLLVGSINNKGEPSDTKAPSHITEDAVLIYLSREDTLPKVYNIGRWDLFDILDDPDHRSSDESWIPYKHVSVSISSMTDAKNNLTQQLTQLTTSLKHPDYNTQRININTLKADYRFYDDEGKEFGTDAMWGLRASPEQTTAYNLVQTGGSPYNTWPEGYYAVIGNARDNGQRKGSKDGVTGNAIMLAVMGESTSILGYWDLVTQAPLWYEFEPDMAFNAQVRENKTVFKDSLSFTMAAPVAQSIVNTREPRAGKYVLFSAKLGGVNTNDLSEYVSLDDDLNLTPKEWLGRTLTLTFTQAGALSCKGIQKEVAVTIAGNMVKVDGDSGSYSDASGPKLAEEFNKWMATLRKNNPVRDGCGEVTIKTIHNPASNVIAKTTSSSTEISIISSTPGEFWVDTQRNSTRSCVASGGPSWRGTLIIAKSGVPVVGIDSFFSSRSATEITAKFNLWMATLRENNPAVNGCGEVFISEISNKKAKITQNRTQIEIIDKTIGSFIVYTFRMATEAYVQTDGPKFTGLIEQAVHEDWLTIEMPEVPNDWLTMFKQNYVIRLRLLQKVSEDLAKTTLNNIFDALKFDLEYVGKDGHNTRWSLTDGDDVPLIKEIPGGRRFSYLTYKNDNISEFAASTMDCDFQFINDGKWLFFAMTAKAQGDIAINLYAKTSGNNPLVDESGQEDIAAKTIMPPIEH